MYILGNILRIILENRGEVKYFRGIIVSSDLYQAIFKKGCVEMKKIIEELCGIFIEKIFLTIIFFALLLAEIVKVIVAFFL